MSYQTSLVVVERTGSSSEDAADVVPILLVLLNLSKSNISVASIIKEQVFPGGKLEEKLKLLAKEEIAKNQKEGTVNAKSMVLLDVPRNTLRHNLIRLMTSIESNVKRAACELLWILCNEDLTQFVLRAGFYNAVYFLGTKHIVDLSRHGVDI